MGEYEVDELHRELGWLLTSRGWNEVVKSAIAERVKLLYQKLIDPSEKRKEALPDDFIRGEITAFKWMIEWPEKEMQMVARAVREAREASLETLDSGATPQ